MKNVIEIKNLVKQYGSFNAVNNISFTVEKGEIFGLLGENGAGKTTTLEMIEGLRRPTSGEINILGLDYKHDQKDIKIRIGVQLQSSAYYSFLTLTEILDLFGGFYPAHLDPAELLASVSLKEKSRSYVGKLSGGQRQRFSIVASLINDPDIVFLDEPTTGLDPRARRRLWDLISNIKKQGKTVVLTTHYLEEAEMLCDHIAILDKGKIVAMDETHKLIAMAKTPFKLEFYAPKLKADEIDKLNKISAVNELVGKSHYYEMGLKTQPDVDAAVKLLQIGSPESFTVGKASLEDVFIELTGKKIAEEEGADD